MNRLGMVCLSVGIAVFAAWPAETRGQKKGRLPVVAFVVSSSSSPDYWIPVDAGAQWAAREEKVTFLFRVPERADGAAQRKLLDDLLRREDLRALAVCPLDPVKQRDFLDRAARGLPLLTVGVDLPGGKRQCFVGFDEYAAGRAAGRLVKEALPGGGAIALFVGSIEDEVTRQRRAGLLDELAGKKGAPEGKAYGKYTLESTYEDGASPYRAGRNAVDALGRIARETDVCLVGLWAYHPPAILEALKGVKRESKVKIVGFDNERATLIGVKSGAVQGTVVQQPVELGYRTVKLLAALAKDPKNAKLPEGGKVLIPPQVITKDNVEKYLKLP